MSERVIVCWSGGKDSVMSLHTIAKDARYEPAVLLTTVTKDYGRISMHGIRESLLDEQAESLGLPVEKVFISSDDGNEQYESKMRAVLSQYLSDGIRSVVFGDIFLEDVRKYRQDNLAQLGMNGIFPLWGRDSRALADEFIDSGFKAVLTCVDSEHLGAEFAGRRFDRVLLGDLPDGVDPCGENGEFHSFVYDGPVFSAPIDHEIGQVVLRQERYHFCDVLQIEKKCSSAGRLRV
jgi:uncharacterized protein (TIGR00290 family)